MSVELLDLLRSRRTVRRFSSQPVSREDIDAVLEAAMYAPSRLNRRPWHFLVLQDSALQREIADLLRVHPYLEQAPTVLVICARTDTSPTWLMDVSAATENLLLAAAALGLGGAWVAEPEAALWDQLEAHLHERLHIPEEIRVVSLVALGHPQETPAPHTRTGSYERLKVHDGLWERVGEIGAVPIQPGSGEV